MDQSSRYVNLSLKEEDLMADGGYILTAYIMKPKAGYGFVATAAHFAAESSTGTNVEVNTTDDYTKKLDAIVYEADESIGLMKIAYSVDLIDRNIIDDRAMVVSFLTLAIGNNQGMGDVEYSKLYDFWIPPSLLTKYDGPVVNIVDLWKVLGRPEQDGGLIVGTIIKPKLGLRPEPFAKAAYDFWLGGDFIKNDAPQGNQIFSPMKETIPLVYDAMKRAMDKTGEAKLFSANITADDPAEIIARGEYVLKVFKEDANKVAFLVDGYVGGVTAVATVRRNFPSQFLHYHRAGHGAVTSPQSKRGYTAFVLSKLARLSGASGIHVGTMGFGKMEGERSDKDIAYIIERDKHTGPYFEQDWNALKSTTPIISGGLNAIRIGGTKGFFSNLGHANVIVTAGEGSYGHLDGAAEGAKSMRQAYQAWKSGVDALEYAKSHKELARAFESFPHDADQWYPEWRKVLGK